MKKVLTIFGTRPEAIKMAPIIKELENRKDQFESVVCVTGQHRSMLDSVLELFDIVPDYDLNIMKPQQDLFDISTNILNGIKDVLRTVEPTLVLVHGDTTTSVMAALASFYCKIPVGHVEAGLRTHNIYSPWPEEMNRQLTARLATYHFTPTLLSKNNLLGEGIEEGKIYVTGNTVIDALLHIREKIINNKSLEQKICTDLLSKGYDVNRLKNRKLILITGHRRENFGDGFLSICRSIKYLSEKYPSVDFVYPVHLNPNVSGPVYTILGQQKNSNVFLIDPLEYISFTYLLGLSYLVLTDSGGVQEEAPSLGKPVLLMRNNTERPEAIASGTVKLVGTDFDKIVQETSHLLDNYDNYNEMSLINNPYGDGKAACKIVSTLDQI